MKNPFRSNSAFTPDEEVEKALEMLKGQLPLFEAPLPTKLASEPPELLEDALTDVRNAAYQLRAQPHKTWLKDAQQDLNDAMEKLDRWLTSSS